MQMNTISKGEFYKYSLKCVKGTPPDALKADAENLVLASKLGGRDPSTQASLDRLVCLYRCISLELEHSGQALNRHSDKIPFCFAVFKALQRAAGRKHPSIRRCIQRLAHL